MIPCSLIDSYQRFEARAVTMFRAGDVYLSIRRWRQRASETLKRTNHIIG